MRFLKVLKVVVKSLYGSALVTILLSECVALVVELVSGWIRFMEYLFGKSVQTAILSTLGLSVFVTSFVLSLVYEYHRGRL